MDELPDMMRLANGKDDCTCNVAEHSPDPREHDQYCAFPLLHRGAAEIARLTREKEALRAALEDCIPLIATSDERGNPNDREIEVVERAKSLIHEKSQKQEVES